MRQGVAKRVSQYKPPGDYGFEAGYKLGWDAAIQWMKGQQMPVPEGVITTSEVLYNLDPKEEKPKPEEKKEEPDADKV